MFKYAGTKLYINCLLDFNIKNEIIVYKYFVLGDKIMKYKMIVSDYDNTLCNKEKVVTKRTKQAIKNYINNGGRFVICTTRPYIGISKIAKDIGLYDEIISSQGASVRNLSDDSVIFQSLFSNEEVREVLKFFDKKSSHIFLASDDMMMAENDDYFTKVCISTIDYPLHKSKTKLIYECDDVDVSQVIVGSYIPMKVSLLTRLAQSKFDNRFEVGLCDRHLLNVTKKGVSKGSAIGRIAEIHGIKKQEIIAFGDSLNDSSMFDYAGTGVAMGNSMRGLKELATVVCDDVENDGLAKYIEQNCL